MNAKLIKKKINECPKTFVWCKMFLDPVFINIIFSSKDTMYIIIRKTLFLRRPPCCVGHPERGQTIFRSMLGLHKTRHNSFVISYS